MCALFIKLLMSMVSADTVIVLHCGGGWVFAGSSAFLLDLFLNQVGRLHLLVHRLIPRRSFCLMYLWSISVDTMFPYLNNNTPIMKIS